MRRPGGVKTDKLWTSVAIKRVLMTEKYIGRACFNKSRVIRDWSTGKTRQVACPPHEVLWLDVPELRVVAEELWNAAHARIMRLAMTIAA